MGEATAQALAQHYGDLQPIIDASAEGHELIADIGSAIGSIAGEMGEQSLIVGCDGRTSTPRIKSALVRAIMESGRDIIDIGLIHRCSTLPRNK